MRSVLMEYEARLDELQSASVEEEWQHKLAAAGMLIGFCLFAVLGFNASKQRVPAWWPLLPLPIAAVSALRFRKHRAAQTRLFRLKQFYERCAQRAKGEWQGSGHTGQEFDDPGHLYARDLGVFGEGSLFELLCTARTAIGRRALAGYLLAEPEAEVTLERQQAVRELAPRQDLRERVATVGEFEFSESKLETFTQWLDSPPLEFPRLLRPALAVSSACLAALLLLGVLGVAALPRLAFWALPLVAAHAAVGLAFRKRVSRTVDSLRSVSLEIEVLREGIGLLEQHRFTSPLLQRIGAAVHSALPSMRRLERLLNAFAERNKEWFYHVSLLLLAGTQLCLAIESWRRKHGKELLGWLDAWGEFEALSSLAGYTHENRDAAFPELCPGPARFEARQLGHPLLPVETCVRNGVTLDGSARFYVVSGSNMSGKSTLLRAIGLNAVLAFAGAPVRAESLRISELSVCASMSVVDSLLNGKSRFLAEVERLRCAIERGSSARPVLFLVDEILSGTNSRDRRAAAEAVVRTLIGKGAIGALSTHDMTLTEIADAEGLNGANVHMGARAEANPMDFDYLLKPGIATETNAIAIARMAGVPV
jgi:hypothetical protein